MAKLKGWYPISPVGRVITASYVCVPVYVAVAQWLGVYPPAITAPVLGGMTVIMLCAVAAKRRKHDIFRAKPHGGGGFTLIELLVVISLIGILTVLVLPLVLNARKAAYESRAKAELRAVAQAVERRAIDIGGYPVDANRGLPPGLEQYLSSGNWPKAPWPDSVYDWDNWAPTDLAHPPHAQTYQISIRFCTSPGVCTFPDEPWAEDFDYYSSAYYCISGSCRAHSSQPLNHPAYCINCAQ